MGPFRCITCGARNDQATVCGSCGAQRFVLAREARNAPGARHDESPPGQLVPIGDAPSLRRGRRGRDEP